MSRGYHAARKQAEIAEHALHDPMTPDRMRELAGQGSVIERGAVAERPDLPLAIMSALTEDSRRSVRASLARNPSLFDHPGVLEKLLEDREPDVLIALVSNPAIDAPSLARLAAHGNRDVRNAASHVMDGSRVDDRIVGARRHGVQPEEGAPAPVDEAELLRRRREAELLARGGARFHGASRNADKSPEGDDTQ